MADEDQGISPKKRRMLQQMFERGSQMASKGQYDYATDMFTQCVLGDPGNLIYVQNFISNLQRKYNNNKKGHKLTVIKGAGARAAVTKSAMQKDWKAVVRSGLEMLKLNPWHTATLCAMSDACEHMEHESCQEAYLMAALEADRSNVEINRKLARAYEAHGDFDGAMVCWQRVLNGKPTDDEARKGLADCHVKKTIKVAKYEEAESSTEVMTDKAAQQERLGTAGPKLSPEKKLEKAIAKNPEEVANYLELADLHFRDERLDEAEQVLVKALEVSGGDVNVRERLEDIRLRRMRDKVVLAEKRRAENPSDEAADLCKRLRVELNDTEVEVYRNRCDRYPNNLAFKYEFGLRLQRAGKPNDAIKVLQEARTDPQRKGDVFLALGECFQEIKQYKLAMTNYVQAIEHISERNQDAKKRAFYRAGKLALGMKDLDAADKFLSELAGMDFGYRNVAELLDKIRELREDEE
ncbi:MAG: tetratricopeptide repeat protein [Planctomycetes bacterium]|nr:tetratricopeptide repeat protein [Planctomycetota bacterium]